MTFFDDNDGTPGHPDSPTPPSQMEPAAPVPAEPLIGDPISYGALHPQPPAPPASILPPDLQISWSWVHLLCFLFFGIVSLVIVQGVFALIFLPHVRPMPPQKELEQYILSKPGFVIGSMVLWYALLFFFLYITLTVLQGGKFWHSLGWRKLNPQNTSAPTKPWIYFLFGCSLSLLVLIVTATMKTPEHLPIQDIFKYRNTAIAFLCMAVFIAPLVEETIFRGYLYPVLVRIVSAVVRFIATDSVRASRVSVLASTIITATIFGVFHKGRLALTWGVFSLLILFGIIVVVIRIIGKDSARTARAGIFSSIILTGFLFGLMHGIQLGWSFRLVFTLVAVGIIFTIARARSGTVFASFLLHLGYNSTIAVITLLGLLLAKHVKFPQN